MTISCSDGLGAEELGQAGSQSSQLWLTGSVTSESQISGAQVWSTGSVQGARVVGALVNATTSLLVGGSADVDHTFSDAGSPYLKGTVHQFTAETIISGGMWVTVSGAAGGASVKARAAAASTVPLGVAVAIAQSGATVDVLARGLAFATCEGTLVAGDLWKMGAGAGLDTVNVVGTGSAGRGVVLAGATSGTTSKALVYIW